MTEPSDGERRRRVPAREVLQQRLELYDARCDEVVLEREVRGDGLSLREGQSEAFGHEIDQLAVIRRDGRTQEAREDVLRFSRRDARVSSGYRAPRPCRGPPPGRPPPWPRGPGPCPPRPPPPGRPARAAMRARFSSA